MFVSFRDFVEYKGYLEQDDEVGQKAYETIDLMFQITYNAFDLLKLVARITGWWHPCLIY